MLASPRKATVTGMDKDPAQAGRIQVRFEDVEGETYPEWVNPVFPPGWFTPPEVGDVVLLEIPDSVGDLIEFPREVRYLGVEKSRDRVADSTFRTNYGKRRGYKTKGGHVLYFDDRDGTIVVKTSSGTSITLYNSSDKVVINTSLTELSKTATHPILFGDTFNTEHAVMLGLVSTYIGLVGTALTALVGDPFMSSLQSATKTALTNAGTAGSGTAVTGIATFLGKAATWISLKVKTG